MAHTTIATNNDEMLTTTAALKAFRQRLEEIEEAMVREAQDQISKGHVTLAKPMSDTANRILAALDSYDGVNEQLFRAILSTEARYSPIQINTEVTLVRCRLADVPEAWDMGGQASTKRPLQAAA